MHCHVVMTRRLVLPANICILDENRSAVSTCDCIRFVAFGQQCNNY